ncbi:MAG: SDR family NAD(P)-dependent oxidoreductase, partial [Proteobacteria bacterium]|nr:SDR family NAD(P)-dependent oxidoreductase [Pseudomonadota bacterium]
MRLENKTAIVTGGASGFGAGIAQRFAHEGASVVVADVNDRAGELTASEIRDSGGDAIYVHADVTSRSDTKQMIAKAVTHSGQLDILINNAGFSHSNKNFTQV